MYMYTKNIFIQVNPLNPDITLRKTLKEKGIFEHIQSWDLLNNINKADEKMTALKEDLKKHDIKKESSIQYEQYLDKIKENVRFIQDKSQQSTVKNDEEASGSNVGAPDAKKQRTSE